MKKIRKTEILKRAAAGTAALLCLLAFSSCKKDDGSSGAGSTAAKDAAASAAETAAQGDIEYTVEDLKTAVKAYQNFGNYGAPCELTDGIVYEEAKKYMTPEQSEWCTELKAVDCCGSIAEAKAHLEKYLDKSMCKKFSADSFVEYRGLLYVALGGVGFTEYDVDGITADSVKRTANNKIYLTVKEYASGGDNYTTERVDFEYIDGAYKIVNVTEAK